MNEKLYYNYVELKALINSIENYLMLSSLNKDMTEWNKIEYKKDIKKLELYSMGMQLINGIEEKIKNDVDTMAN